MCVCTNVNMHTHTCACMCTYGGISMRRKNILEGPEWEEREEAGFKELKDADVAARVSPGRVCGDRSPKASEIRWGR